VAKLIILGDDPENGRGLAGILRREGHAAVFLREGAGGAQVMRRNPELLVLSVREPTRVMNDLAATAGRNLRRIPAIAILSREASLEGVSSGAPGAPADFTVDAVWETGKRPPSDRREPSLRETSPWLVDPLPMPFSDATLLGRVDGLLRVARVLAHSPEAGCDLVSLPAPEAAPGGGLLGRMLRGFRRGAGSAGTGEAPLGAGSPGARLQTAAALVSAVESRDTFDPGHGDRVAFHCATIATALGIPDEEAALLLHAAWAHDIGKIALPPELLSKPVLTPGDRELLRSHPRRGAQLLRVLSPWPDAAGIVACHHERPDGAGYYGLSPQRVPRGAWILSVAEAYDAMTRSRSQGRAALPPEEAIERLQEGRGTAWDADSLAALTAFVRPRRSRARGLSVSPWENPLEEPALSGSGTRSPHGGGPRKA
jgi:HD-GYP domain-containing protein (c-di-GMP phosphodiesterase class II)